MPTQEQSTMTTRGARLAGLGVAWFWAFFAWCWWLVPVADFLLIAVWLGALAVGALLCVRLVGGRVEIGFAPIGTVLMSLFALDFAEHMHSDQALRLLIDMAGMGLGGGLFVVPLYAFSQWRCRDEALGWMSALIVIGAALFSLVLLALDQTLQHLGMDPVMRLQILALSNLVIAVYIYKQIPEFFMRLVLWLIVHVMYRIDTQGLHKIPRDGPALLVCNHVSFLDPIIVGSNIPRPARFVMYHKIWKLPLAHQFFKTVKAIAIAPAKEDPEMLEEAYRRIAHSLDDGDLVVIYPEGGITYDGEIQPFRSGMERILERNPVPVIPLALRGAWGSWFSRYGGKALSGLPRRFRARIELVVGDPIAPEDANAALLEEKVRALRGDAR
ncbi:MAG: 1-acyl-sn-glycerol-3-phosphate acyltransferase [Salinisphaeraceae bacterium]|nr:1-acyl-sn-glycerol-3-phosphate acyltransferase [Salinisphaeraceae bacterium]